MNEWQVIKTEFALKEVFEVIKQNPKTGEIKKSGFFDTEKKAQALANKLNRVEAMFRKMREGELK